MLFAVSDICYSVVTKHHITILKYEMNHCDAEIKYAILKNY